MSINDWRWPDDYFVNDSRGFRLEKQLGEGGFGEAWLVKREVNGRIAQRFVAKYAHEQSVAATIITEQNMLRRMYGAMHIVQPIVSNRDLLHLDSYQPSPLWPLLMTEFIPGITYGEFYYRIMDNQDELWPPPNRMLWLIFRCLARTVFGLANPPNKPMGDVNEEPTLEPLPDHEPTLKDYQIAHNDMNQNNLMFNDLDTGEHSLVPVLKLLDFGVARDTTEWTTKARTPTQSNIRDIGEVMQRIYDEGDPNVDADLKRLVAQCVDNYPENRPTLAALWGQISNAILLKTGPGSFPGCTRANMETDNRIRQYVQMVMLNADYKIPQNYDNNSGKGKGKAAA
ncbi:hypothetical protein F4810DRAFT_715517 [Camillea tinctor]|nr:hypothetical protein F4810DRAFT_715517 [Camillea tinctor]